MESKCCSHCNFAQKDHDLLTTMSANMAAVFKDLQETKKDHEIRLRRVEIWGFISMGVLYTVTFFKQKLLGPLGLG